MNDLKVRQAVAYGLDRASVVKRSTTARGRWRTSSSPRPVRWTNKVQKYAYNPTKAKALLNSSSCHVPCKIDFWYPTASRGRTCRIRSGTSRRSPRACRLGLHGHRAQRSVASDVRPKVNEGSAGDLNLIGWTGDYGDPDNFLGTFFRTTTRSSGSTTRDRGILNQALNQPNFRSGSRSTRRRTS
jgi:peptide/nickel transport system substrate-binding protein